MSTPTAPTGPVFNAPDGEGSTQLGGPTETQTVADIMSRHVEQVDVDTPLVEAARLMAQAHISSVLITQRGQPVGILTERDLLRLFTAGTPSDTAVSWLMSAPLCTAKPTEFFADVWGRMVTQGLRHLVVTDASGQALGLVTETDFRNHTDQCLLAELGNLAELVERAPLWLPPTAPLSQALHLMLEQRSTYVLIVHNHRAIGILTERDIPRLMSLANVTEQAVGPLANAALHTASESIWMSEAVAMMQRLDVRHLVVVEADGQLAGLVQTHRIMTRLGEHLRQRQNQREQLALQERSRKAEQRLEMAAEAAKMGFWEVNLLTGEMSMSGYTSTLMGADLSNNQGTLTGFLATIEPEDRTAIARAFEQAHAANAPRSMALEYRIRRPNDGQQRWLQSVGQTTDLDASGRAARALGVTTDITERKQQQALLDDSLALLQQRKTELEHLSRTINSSPVIAMTWAAAPGWPILYASDNVSQWGHQAADLMRDGTTFQSLLHPDDLERITHEVRQVLREQRNHYDQTYRLRTAHGQWLWIDDHTWVERDEHHRVTRVHGVLTDITARRWLEKISHIERDVLASMARGRELPALLTELVLHHEALMPDVLGSVLLLDRTRQTLHLGAAPSLPSDYSTALEGLVIGPMVGSCGTAVFTQQTVVVSDIANDPLWANFAPLALSHGLKACWSVPIVDSKQGVLGTFAMYMREPSRPTQEQLQAIERGAYLAGLVIERDQTAQTVGQLSLAVEQSPNSIVITNLQGDIEYANQAFFAVSGYTPAEIMGKNPRILKSGKTAASTYVHMWRALNDGNAWKGEFTNQRKDGTEYTESVRISPVQQADGRVTHYLGIKEDITRQKQAEQQIYRLAYFDVLTGLPNRQLLADRFQQGVNLCNRQKTPLALMFIELDHFKHIHDSLGHSVGDELLVQVARRLESLVRAGDTLSRQGGDEFVLVLPGCGQEEARQVAHKLVEQLGHSFTVGGHDMVVTLSVGISLYPSDGVDFETLSKSADVAMYRAKDEGRNTFRLFTPDMQARSGRTLMLENSLRGAMDRGELELVYQPQTSLANGALVGVEALLRWRHPELGMVSPAEFIPLAETGGQILRIGEWVLRTAAFQLKRWMDEGLDAITVAVNLSAVQFRDAGLTAMVAQALHDTGLPPSCLELELTESAAMNDPLGAVVAMDEISALRVSMSIDDFGTGYSSLSYLKRFKVGKLKIDQSFVRDLTTDPDDKAIVGAIIGLASNLGLRTIAEGVETPGQLAWLRLQGCDEAQGYFFSPPLPPLDLLAWVKANNLYPGQLPR